MWTLSLVLLAAQEVNPRYELAWRLRELERSWIAHAEKERRVEALPHVEEAVTNFFSFDVEATAEALDTARAVLVGGPEDVRKRWPDGLAVTPLRRFLDRGNDELELTFVPLYGEPDGREWFLWLSAGGRESIEGEVRVDGNTPAKWSSVLLQWPEGDYTASLRLADGDFTTHDRPLSFSIAAKRDARLAELKTKLAALPENAPALERTTASDTLALLERLAKGATEETDYPAARLLKETEQLVASAAKGERWFTRERGGEFWLSIPNGKSAARVRLFVPDALAADKPVPLVVALHGAGGSENMFFDAYGDGLAVKLCRQRGWMLVAPRVTFGGAPVEAVIDALAERYPLDRTRMFLVGHSMGAGVGQALVAKAPKSFRAFAALGGGSGLKDAGRLIELPIFVGAGERDFGRRGAEALHASLVAAGAKSTQLAIYPNCEHLMVVVDALPDVFSWFDTHME